MVPRIGVDMTVDEALACVAGLVKTLGFARVLRTAIAAAREEAGQLASQAERDFQLLSGVAVAAGLEKEGDDGHET